MATYRGRKFEGGTIKITGHTFIDCEIVGAEIEYDGRAGVSLIRTNLIGCRWKFTGPAMRTVAFMRSMAQVAPELGQQFIAAIGAAEELDLREE